MGEVYRADDLKIGQPVALKFLPANLERDPDRLQRLFGEVRIARQVSHPNVCRVYDVGEFDRHSFITMEYVDGEDLAALLRRIGRLPQEKALDVARQIAAGLAAAHAQGIVHRDLKPANIMLDGRGRARITDFGLAVAAEAVRGMEARSGTPGYMAPEQLAGSAITPRTDVYALGLVLFELFTGRQAAGEVPRPSTVVPGLDPTVDAAILKCLEKDPARRPASAMEVLRILPGGDPLEAALQAGETPSPEMVAAAGEEGALSPGKAWGLLGLVLLVLAAAIVVSVNAIGLDRVRMTKSPDVLTERAREIVRVLGDAAPQRSIEWWVGLDLGYAEWSRSHPRAFPLADTGPSAIRFNYRGSSETIFPWRRFIPTRRDPPMSTSGDSYIALDLQGNLLDFSRLDRQVAPPDSGRGAPDWGSLLAFAGVESLSARAVPPLWTPDVPSDSRSAWAVNEGQARVRLEAASWKGKPVWLRTIEPWELAERDAPAALDSPVGQVAFIVMALAISLGMGILARHNVRAGRGDMRGAVRVAAVILLAFGLADALNFRWSPDPFHIWTFVYRGPYFPALVLGLTYLGVEPFVRRRWPRRLIGWTRLLEGRWIDPLVGREVLLGLLAGGACVLLSMVPAVLENRQDTDSMLVFPLGRAADFWAGVVDIPADGLMKGLGGFGLLLLLRVIARRDSIAWLGLLALTVSMFVASWNLSATTWIGIVAGAACIVLAARVGVVAATAAFTTTNFLGWSGPLTLDFSRWYAWRTGVIAALLLAMALWGFRAAMGRRRILPASMLEG